MILKFVHNPEGYIRYYGPEEHYHFYHIKDLLGNVRETHGQQRLKNLKIEAI